MTSGSVNTASYWEQESFLYRRNLVIVGSGIVGLATALMVSRQRPQWSILVIDRGTLPDGASTKNAGFACFGSPSELLADVETSGWDSMVSLVKRRWQGLGLLRKLVGESNMQYTPSGGYEVFDHHQQNLYERCLAGIPELNEALSFIGPEVFGQSTSLGDHGLQSYYGMLQCPYEAAIDPGRMMAKLISECLTAGIQFLNGLQITSLEDRGDYVEILGNGYVIKSDLVLLSTNAFTRKLLPEIDVYPARNQVLVTTPISNLKLQGVFHHDHGYVYFRNIGNRLLIGGGRNKFADQERTDVMTTTDNVVDYLIHLLQTKIIPGKVFDIEYKWSGIIGLGPDKTPIAEWQSDRIFAACRMGGMGISIGALISESATKEIISR